LLACAPELFTLTRVVASVGHGHSGLAADPMLEQLASISPIASGLLANARRFEGAARNSGHHSGHPCRIG
jgi:hypothetical protein